MWGRNVTVFIDICANCTAKISACCPYVVASYLASYCMCRQGLLWISAWSELRVTCYQSNALHNNITLVVAINTVWPVKHS